MAHKNVRHYTHSSETCQTPKSTMFGRTNIPSPSRKEYKSQRGERSPTPEPHSLRPQAELAGGDSKPPWQPPKRQLFISSHDFLHLNRSFSTPGTARRPPNVQDGAQFGPPSNLADQRPKLGYDFMQGELVRNLIQDKRNRLEASGSSSSSSDRLRPGATPANRTKFPARACRPNSHPDDISFSFSFLRLSARNNRTTRGLWRIFQLFLWRTFLFVNFDKQCFDLDIERQREVL